MSVKDMSDQQLNMHLEILLGAKEDRHRKGNVIKGDYSTSPKDYCTDAAASLEVQTAAIRVNAKKYFNHLERRIHPGLAELPESDTWSAFEVAEIVRASPRQRAEAAYITLSSLD
ncbi:hypothetical protein P4H71_06885 [Paenibacillus kribbensis]|uniref:hypothetical protein n=1 Tax=Paenibacillus kribbensis TaxID=172713 RepID=UPI002DB626BC|nr:hypothetical protein [Paenibacillus kribbensis]MEC0234055.1 hypothetical protein [Paenibacillus kribbensis]